MISPDVPKHLVVGARTGFLNSVRETKPAYTEFTETFPMDGESQELVDIGDHPMPKHSPTGMTVQDYVERSLTLKATEWDITVFIEYNLSKDDQTRQLEKKVKGAGRNFQKHMNKRAFQFLNAGDGSTYGLCYDGENFFSASHVDKGATYQTAQDNEDGANLSLANFNTTWGNAQGFLSDQGEFSEYQYDLLITHFSNRDMAAQITKNPQKEGTGNRDINDFSGEIKNIFSPYFDNNAWILVATGEGHKPLILGLRETPHLQHAWFLPDKPKGGWYMLKFYGRYEFHYGDWRTAIMGQT